MLFRSIGGTAVVLAAILFFVLHHPTPAPQPTDAAAFLGKWQTSVEPPGGDDLEKISVSQFNGQLMVEAWGKCGKGFCNWGPKVAALKNSTIVTEVWDLRNTPQETQDQRSAVLSVQPSANGLEVTVRNTYHTANGQEKQVLNPLQFVKMP